MSEKSHIRVLFVADIVGLPGLNFAERMIPIIRKEQGVDFCIANGENVNHGRGLTDKLANRLFSIGVDVITSGNHIWDNHKKAGGLLEKNPRILRPLNYPQGNPGRGAILCTIPSSGDLIGVINLQGRTFMFPIDCPFQTGEVKIRQMAEKTRIIIVDFHAEATAEKLSFAWYFDGRVSAIIGTHTHVQTADERILPRGTAYITDVGMTGAFDSVIGMKREVAVHRFRLQTPQKYQISDENVRFCGVIVDIDRKTGKSIKIKRLNLP